MDILAEPKWVSLNPEPNPSQLRLLGSVVGHALRHIVMYFDSINSKICSGEMKIAHVS